jgi:hypothetical protein
VQAAQQREQTAKEEADAAKRREMAMVQEAAVEVAKCREVAQASMREAENAKRELEHHRHAEAEARRSERVASASTATTAKAMKAKTAPTAALAADAVRLALARALARAYLTADSVVG